MRFGPGLNLVIAWLGILLGLLSGLILGLNFQREEWLGGYGSLKRRLYRLAHISLFGLGTLNLLFFLTSSAFTVGSRYLAAASAAFVVGAITMPICCVLMVHWPRTQSLFAVPVLSLILGTALTVNAVLVYPKAVAHSSRPELIPVGSPTNSFAVQQSSALLSK